MKNHSAGIFDFRNIFMLALLSLSAFAFGSCSRSYTITVENPSDVEAVDVVAVAELPDGLDASEWCVCDAEGNPLVSQLLADGRIAFPADVAPQSTAEYTLRKGQPQQADTLLTWMVRLDCQDDFAWENSHSGYRLYGPLFKQQWGNVHGYDLWCKGGAAPIVKRLYDLDHGPEQISYHVDHGEGFDGYTVGPTLGAGACALLRNDTICYPTAYDDYEVLDFGPLRMSVRFTIDSIPYGDRYVREIRTVTLDHNAYFNHVSTRFEGLDEQSDIVAGIVVHADNPEGYLLTDKAVAVTDLSDNLANNNGEIYVGVISPSAESSAFVPFENVVANAVGQVILRSTIQPNETFDYYFGSEWTKNSVASADEWNEIISNNAKQIASPLIVTVR